MVDVKNYEGLYAVTEDGQVWSYRRQRFMKLSKEHDGYLVVNLSRDGKCIQFKVHRLIAQAFIPNPENKPEINHRDEDKSNNCVDNLEWATRKENINYGTRNERAGRTISRLKKGA